MSVIALRDFIRTASMGMGAAPFVRSGALRRTSPNETIGHAVIGTGGQGGGHCRRFAASNGCQWPSATWIPSGSTRRFEGFLNFASSF
jgi:hypothetical protein